MRRLPPQAGSGCSGSAPPEAPNWSGYMDRLPQDPWGRPYQYEAGEDLSRRGRVISLGADGEPGGEGLNADIDPRRVDPSGDGIG